MADKKCILRVPNSYCDLELILLYTLVYYLNLFVEAYCMFHNYSIAFTHFLSYSHTVIHGAIQEVSVVPIPSVPTIQCEGGETSRLCVGVHALNDKHVVLQSFAPVGLPFRHKDTSSIGVVQVAGRTL